MTDSTQPDNTQNIAPNPTQSTPEEPFVSTSDFIFGTLATDELRLAAITKARRGFFHENQPHDPLPGQSVMITVTAGPDAPVTQAIVLVSTDATFGTYTHRLQLQHVRTEWDTLLWAYVNVFEAEMPVLDVPKVRYMIQGFTSDGRTLWAQDGQEKTIFSYNIDTYRVPFWVQDAVVYHVFMDRFAPNPGAQFADHDDLFGFFGGTLRGVQSKLDYIQSLGANAIWLSPIYPSPSHHGYDYTDLQGIDPRYGTKDDFRALVDDMHRRGMRMILDFVPSHTSNEHPHFVAAQADANSPYVGYYTFTNHPHEYKAFFNVPTLPTVNHDDPGARATIIDSAVYWLSEFGVDGLRLDYAHGPSHDFWTDFYAAVKKANPESWHFGEIVETPTLLRSYEGRMDGTLDFNFLQNVRRLFAFGTATPMEFEQFLSAHEAFFDGRNFSLPSFLDNHDMNRILWAVRGDVRKLKQAAVCQFTMNQPPILYYGTEVGLSQNKDVRGWGLEQPRLPMIWDEEKQNADLLSFYRTLIAARHTSAAMRAGSRSPIVVSANGYGYMKQYGDDEVIALFNLTESEQEFQLPVGTWRDVFGGTLVSEIVTLPARGFLLATAADE